MVLPLTPSDRIALTVAGMSACLGAVVRAPITSIVIQRDGVELERHIPPRSFTAVLNRPVASTANFSPVTAKSLDREAACRSFAGVPYRQLPVLIDHRIVGVIDRQATEAVEKGDVPFRPALCLDSKTSIRDAIDLMVNHNTELLLLTSDGHLVGIVTLHDVLRFENQLAELE